MSWWAVAAAALLIAAVTWNATSWLLSEAGTADDPGAARVEAIKTGLGVAAGAGGLFALLLAVRRQWHQEVTATDTTHDATERRVTELYTKAVEQLGSEKAPVRLGGLYALERVAQDNPRQRQTIVNVICSYLRMPYTLPDRLPATDVDDAMLVSHQDRVQEGEVRLAAQRILAHHFHPTDVFNNYNENFWNNIDVDFTGATLIDFNFSHCLTQSARFSDVTFIGDAWFKQALFFMSALFDGASFTGNARFTKAGVVGVIVFKNTTFADEANFKKATFTNGAYFDDATFAGNTDFEQVTFNGAVSFNNATLPSNRYTVHASTCHEPWTNFLHAKFKAAVPSELVQYISPSNEDDTGTT